MLSSDAAALWLLLSSTPGPWRFLEDGRPAAQFHTRFLSPPTTAHRRPNTFDAAMQQNGVPASQIGVLASQIAIRAIQTGVLAGQTGVLASQIGVLASKNGVLAGHM